MSWRHWRPEVSADYAATARAHAIDVAAMLVVFVAVSVATGGVWRFPFDDELLTRTLTERGISAAEFAAFFLRGGDVHPPLAFLIFYGLLKAGAADWGLRLFSLAMTALSLALFHILCLTLVRQRGAVTPLIRWAAILLFGLCALAISQGDAMRWYPLFAALIALTVVLYLAPGNRAARLWSAVALGLAASTNFLALFVALALFIYRYALQRQRFDGAYWAVTILFGSAGLVTACSIVMNRWGVIAPEVFPLGIVNATAIDALGLLGGASVGVGNAWIIVPAALVMPFAIVAAINRRDLADPAHLLLLLLVAIPIMALAGFAEPRAFLYLMPVIVTLQVLFIAARRSVIILIMLLTTSVGAVANIKHTTHPFKRHAAVPFQEVIDFIKAGSTGRVLVLSSDPVVAFLVRQDDGEGTTCVSYFMQRAGCLGRDAVYDTVVVVSGHSHRAGRDAFMQRYAGDIAALTAGKQKTGSMPFGHDADAALKQWLTGTPLSTELLTVDVYR